MKILIVTHHFLDGNGGGVFASRAFINAFAAIAKQTLLVYPENGKNIEPFISKSILRKGVWNNKSKLAKLIDIYRGKLNRFHKDFFLIVDDFKPEIVVFDNSKSSAGYIEKLKTRGIKVITIHHNYEIEYSKGNPISILYRIPFMYYLKNAEKKAVRMSDLNLTLTDQDIDLLKFNYSKNKEIAIENLGCFEFQGKNQEYSNKTFALGGRKNEAINFIITGSLDAAQTESGLLPFIKSYFSILLKYNSESKLIIAGQNPTKKIQEACLDKRSNIKLIANPSNMQEVISAANVYLCPTSVGGGIKLRIMDGLKVGLPILTHKVSSRGYDEFKKAGYLFEYDNEFSFEKGLESIISLMENEKFDSDAIRKLYHSKFSFESGVERLRKILIKYNFVASNNQ
nr:glycosyltransferase [uncultured Flavobacterium sp.]